MYNTLYFKIYLLFLDDRSRMMADIGHWCITHYDDTGVLLDFFFYIHLFQCIFEYFFLN